MNQVAIGLGRGVCTAAEATLGYAQSCSGAANLALIGSFAGFLTLMLAGGILLRRI